MPRRARNESRGEDKGHGGGALADCCRHRMVDILNVPFSLFQGDRSQFGKRTYVYVDGRTEKD
jgi:hypothetical protein